MCSHALHGIKDNTVPYLTHPRPGVNNVLESSSKGLQAPFFCSPGWFQYRLLSICFEAPGLPKIGKNIVWWVAEQRREGSLGPSPPPPPSLLPSQAPPQPQYPPLPPHKHQHQHHPKAASSWQLRRWGSSCRQGHAPRPTPKLHHQHVQAQAKHTVAAAVRRARTAPAIAAKGPHETDAVSQTFWTKF